MSDSSPPKIIPTTFYIMDQLTELTTSIDDYLGSKSKAAKEKVINLVKQPGCLKLWIFDPDYKRRVSVLQALLADEDPFLADFVLSHFCSGFTSLLKAYKKGDTVSSVHVVAYLQFFNRLIEANFHSIKEDLEGPVMSMLYLLDDAAVRPDILLILTHLKQVDKRISDYCEFERTAEYYVDSFLNELGLQELNSFLYECISHLILIFPETVSKYASNETFLELLSKDISRLTTLNPVELENNPLLLKILYMLSNLCIDEQNRNLIHERYSKLLSKLLTVSFSTLTYDRAQLLLTLSALVIVKTWHMPSMGDKGDQLAVTYDIFIAGVISDVPTEVLELSLEGLTYLSIKVEAKRMIRNDDDLLITILQLLKNKKNVNLAYGILSILENITSTETPDESISAALQDTEKDDSTEILNFIFHILAHQDLMSSLLALFKEVGVSKLVHNSIINLLYNIVCFKETRSIVFEQKGLDILFSHLISTKDSQDQFPLQLVCIEAVSKILLTTNPELVVEKYDLTPVAFLVQLVQAYDHQKYQTKYKTLFVMHLASKVEDKDVFEAIISLTNLASVLKMDLKKFISNAVLPCLSNFLINEVHSIRQSILELLSNLSDCPDCLQYVFNWSKPDTKKNYDTLLSLLYHQEPGPCQSALLSFFANASVYDLVADVLVDNKEFISFLSKILDTQRPVEPVVERTLFILINCGQISATKLRQTLPKDFNDVLNQIIRNFHSTELRKMCLEVGKLLKPES